jgi:hypothetical protein
MAHKAGAVDRPEAAGAGETLVAVTGSGAERVERIRRGIRQIGRLYGDLPRPSWPPPTASWRR